MSSFKKVAVVYPLNYRKASGTSPARGKVEGVRERARPQSPVNSMLDLRGMIIPVTYLKITQALRKMKAGETMEIVGRDPVTRRDLFKILQSFSYDLLDINDEPEQYRIRLKKGNSGHE